MKEESESAKYTRIVVEYDGRRMVKAPGIHCYVAGSIPAITPRYYTKEHRKCSSGHKKKLIIILCYTWSRIKVG